MCPRWTFCCPQVVRLRPVIDVLEKRHFAPLKKLRIGLITNHTGINRQRKPTIDILKAAPDVQLKVLFSPEDRYEVDVQGDDYLILRERDIHAVASERIDGGTGLYL